MMWIPDIGGVKSRFPGVEKVERVLLVGDLIAEIVGDATVSVDAVEMRAQALGQKPGGDGKILVVRPRQALAPRLRLGKRRPLGGRTVLRQSVPEAVGGLLFRGGHWQDSKGNRQGHKERNSK